MKRRKPRRKRKKKCKGNQLEELRVKDVNLLKTRKVVKKDSGAVNLFLKRKRRSQPRNLLMLNPLLRGKINLLLEELGYSRKLVKLRNSLNLMLKQNLMLELRKSLKLEFKRRLRLGRSLWLGRSLLLETKRMLRLGRRKL
jgi:hypothetical protein